MDKIVFDVYAKSYMNQCYDLRFPNRAAFVCGSKGDKLDRGLHVKDKDVFKVTIEKVKQ